MTGFASAVASAPDHVSDNADEGEASTAVASRKNASGGVGAELRSVNSRFLDLSFKVADEFRALEPAFRDMLTAAFKRGKIELRQEGPFEPIYMRPRKSDAAQPEAEWQRVV